MNPMNPHVEKAYKAWRATKKDDLPLIAVSAVVAQSLRVLGVSERPRKYVGTGRYKRTAAHKEATRKGALKRWAKAKLRRVPPNWSVDIQVPEAFTVKRVPPREAILDVLLRAKGPLTKAEIVERAGLTPGRKSVPHFSGLLRTKTIRKVGDNKVALAKGR